MSLLVHLAECWVDLEDYACWSHECQFSAHQMQKTIDSIEAYVAVRKFKYVKVFKKNSPFRLPEP
ncbi:MAG TPA: hypothetical protein ENG10_00960 [Candidatus Bathyarchaeota archaeon]|nr:hypothetical protein [Candidatus Bathyarchaeota archaeon]HEX68851.1 hypothetical protein [Candidatus Bathyarchaeota archaeon]